MLAVIAAILFAVGFILSVAGAHLGNLDGVAWLLAGGFFLALHAAWPYTPWRHP